MSYSDYRHPKHEQILRLLRNGLGARTVARQLGVHNGAVVRVRDIEGLKRHSVSTSPQEKVAKFSVPLEGGHTGWSGRRATKCLTPVIRQLKIQVPASHVAFETRTGRPPVGIIKAECGMDQCITPSHISDEIERRDLRGQERALHGLPSVPWDVCSKGRHGWAEHGRFEPDLSAYCKTCNTERAARSRAARKAAA